MNPLFCISIIETIHPPNTAGLKYLIIEYLKLELFKPVLWDMIRILILIILTIAYANSNNNLFVIDSKLYSIQDEKKFLLAENIVDIFNYDNKTYLVQQNGDNLTILKVTRYKFIPFINNKTFLRNVTTIKNLDNLIGVEVKKNKIFLVAENKIITLNPNFKVENEIALVSFKTTFLSNSILTLKNSSSYYIYDIENLNKPLFNVSKGFVLQISKINDYYLGLILQKSEEDKLENEYTLEIAIFTNQNNTFHPYTLLQKKVKVSYDSIYYFIPIQNKYIILQEKDESNIYELDMTNKQNPSLKGFKKINSFYSYFEDNLLFTINSENLTIYDLQGNEFNPLLSIPNVNLIFYSKGTLYYLQYNSQFGIWKLSSINFYKNSITNNDLNIPFYSLPEEVIPL
ncbi:MAG: hypothetical protein ABDH21_05150 [bacterium]